MKHRLWTVLGLLISLAIVTSLIATAVSAAPPAGKGKQKVIWSESKIADTIAPGGTATYAVTFTSTKDLANPVLKIPAVKTQFIQVTDFPASIVANTPYTINVTVSVPADTERARINANLFVKDGKTYAYPLKVRITVGEESEPAPTATTEPTATVEPTAEPTETPVQ